MKISSDAFVHNGSIPTRYTGDGPDLSPPLTFTDVPRNCASLALIVDDPDAPVGTWDHWVVWNIPPTTRTIPENSDPPGVVGRNSWNRNHWGGPCPPSGEHRYVFKFVALDKEIDLPATARRTDLERAMCGHVIEEAEIVGRYSRRLR